jgi:hypothetical protein
VYSSISAVAWLGLCAWQSAYAVAGEAGINAATTSARQASCMFVLS